jgi:ATP-dependent Clp protease protease subunit
VEKITHDWDRDFYLSAEQAKEYGIVDDILNGNKEKKNSATCHRQLIR